MNGDYIKNFERYKGIIKEPYMIGDEKIYEVDFLGLNELYEFLVSNPPINTNSFPKTRSQVGLDTAIGKDLFELSYEDALKFLLGGYNKNIEELFQLEKSLEAQKRYSANKTRVIRSQSGSRVCINGFVSNSPKKFYRLERMEEKKFIRIHVNMSFRAMDGVKNVLHRGVLLKNFVDLLESNNYNVDLNTFILLRGQESEELFYFKVNLKKINSSMNLQDIIFPLTSLDFLRRIVFRVMESVPFQGRKWYNGYGGAVYEDEVKRLLNISSRDIYVGTPNEIGINGLSLKDDADEFLEYVAASNYVRVLKK